MSPKHIAVLIVCHNRKNKTLACLRDLTNQVLPAGVKLSTYLVDDGSIDGTKEAIKQKYPKVKLILGDGSLYWCGGMRLALNHAKKGNPDYYFWLNDDTVLFSNAIHVLFESAQFIQKEMGKDGIVVGAIRDPDVDICTYGGMLQVSHKKPFNFIKLKPSGRRQRCDTFNGNCVLIAKNILEEVGNLSPEFTHGIGDTDYGLRAKAKGFVSWLSPEYVGSCKQNLASNKWSDPDIPLRMRWKLLHSPKGIPPYEYMILTKRHAGRNWPIYILKLYLRVIWPSLWQTKDGVR